MKKIVSMFLKTFFGKDLNIKVRMFNVLAMTGFVVCVIMTILSAFNSMFISMFINLAAGIFSLCMLIVSVRKKNYKFCYMATTICVFFVLFPCLFFMGGGYNGGMPFFFIFAVGFTVYMLDGWRMVVTSIAELLVYTLLSIFAYYHPEYIVPFESEKAMLTDMIIAFLTVSAALGVTMFIQVKMYGKQSKELEEARRDAESASKAKSVFLASMSHEIRTPIHMILGMNEVIYRETRSPSIKQYSEKIDESSKMLLSLVDSVLDVSKIESGKTELINGPYKTADLVNILALIGKTDCGKKNLEFLLDVSDTMPEVLYGDISHIKQIASNLLSNAAKYTNEGRVILKITERDHKGEDLILSISVEDTGIGIRPEAISTLFDSFTRADVASHRYIEGSGLGLAIVKNLTTLMGGDVHVSSEFGKGSIFTVDIPQKEVVVTNEEKQEDNREFCAPGACILIVDDNEGNRMLMRSQLADTKIHIDTAESGAECLTMVKENNYNIIFMDYMMPVMDGLQTLENLQKTKDFSVPVVALTADATSETRNKLLNAGFAEFLSKPVSRKDIEKVILKFLPQELVVESEKKEEDPVDREYIDNIAEKLVPYGIVLEKGMKYFSDSFSEYCEFALMLTGHYKSEREKIETALENDDFETIHFGVHTIKGKAKNMGMTRLADTAAYTEELCHSHNDGETRSIMPYLFYVWEKACNGLEYLISITGTKKKENINNNLNVEECDRKLEEYLRDFRRKPSLDCLEVLKNNETDPELREILEEAETNVSAIAFDKAAQIYQTYREIKKGN